MFVKIDKKFQKDLNKITDKKLILIVIDVIEAFKSYSRITEIPKVRKMVGYPFHYRIRIGDYRMGIIIKSNVVYFERFLHRSEIYKYFP
jgi:mRNA interferase RelE/StbE